MEKRNITCIVCPKSCRGEVIIHDDGTLETRGFDCKNGDRYAKDEVTDPKRMLTTTIPITGAAIPLLPVVSSAEISKKELKACLDLLYGQKAAAPVAAGEIIVKDILDTGVDIIAARTLDRKERQ